jgi:hypothetical protein
MGADWAIQPAVRSQQHEAPTNIQSRISKGSLAGQRTHTHRVMSGSVANSIECDLATVEDCGLLAVPLQANGHAPCRSWGEDVAGFGV